MRHIHLVLKHLAKGRAILVHPSLKRLAPRHKAMKHDVSSMMHHLSLGEGVKHHAVHHKVGHKKRPLHFKL